MSLIDAANRGDAAAVRQLLAAGADPAARGAHGETALHLAAVGGSVEIVRCLLDAGAGIDARDLLPQHQHDHSGHSHDHPVEHSVER